MKIAVTLVNMDLNQVNYIQMENWESHLKAKIHIWTDKYKLEGCFLVFNTSYIIN